MGRGAIKAHAAGLGGGFGAILATAIVTQWPDMAAWQEVLTIGLPAVVGWIATYRAPANQ